jgi:hypothetical protein
MHSPFQITSRSHLVRLLLGINGVTLLLVLGAIIWSTKPPGSILPIPTEIVYSLPSPLLRLTSLQPFLIKADQFYLRGTLLESDAELKDRMETEATTVKELSP